MYINFLSSIQDRFLIGTVILWFLTHLIKNRTPRNWTNHLMNFKNHKALTAIIVLSLLLKIILLGITDTYTTGIPLKGALIGNLTGDQSDYYRRAIAITEGKGYHYYSTFRAPLYPIFLSVTFYLFNRSVIAVKLIQILLSTITVFIIYLLAKRMFNKRVGLVSAFIFAFYPNLIFFTHNLWTETLFIFLLTSSVYFLMNFHYTRRNGNLLLAGVLWGLASLTRAIPLYFLPLIFFWFMVFEAGGYKEKIFCFSIFALVVCAVIAPWTYRNYLVHRSFVPIATNGGWNFRTGNNTKSVFIAKEDCWDWGFTDGLDPEWFRRKREALVEKRMYKKGIDFILNNKYLFFKKSLWEGRHFYTLDSFAIRHLRNEWYGNLPLPLIRVLTVFCVLSYIIVMLTGTAGLIYSKNDAPKWFFILLICFLTFLHSIVFSMSRYRVPVIPFIIIYSSYCLTHLSIVWKNIRISPQVFILTTCLIFWIMIWTFDIPLISDMLLTGGKNYQFKYIPG